MANSKQINIEEKPDAVKPRTPAPSVSSTSAASTGGGGSGAATATARSIYDQAKETAGEAYEVAADKATTKLEETKSDISGGLATVAGSVRQVSDNLRGPEVKDGISQFTAEYSELAAKKIESAAGYLEKTNIRDMYADLEGFARRNPAFFIGGAFALGLIAARFLKSGPQPPLGESDNPATQSPGFDGQSRIGPV